MGYVVIILIIGVIWIVAKVFESVSDGNASVKKNQLFCENRNQKYKDRLIDKTKNLFERNIDIISDFEEKISLNSGYHAYYIENETCDCIKEICLAEGRFDLTPSSYLSTWRLTAPKEWIELSREVEKVLLTRKKELSDLQHEIVKIENNLKDLSKKRLSSSDIKTIVKKAGEGNINIKIVQSILSPNIVTWSEKEDFLINYNGIYNKFPLLKKKFTHKSIDELNNKIKSFNQEVKQNAQEHLDNKELFFKLFEGYEDGIKEQVIERLNFVLDDIKLPKELPKYWDIDFDKEQSIAIVEIKLPDVVHNEIYKEVKLKNGIVNKPLNQKETRENVPSIHPAIILRIAYEIFRNDTLNIINLLVVNGWVEYNNPNTGIKTKTYTASLVVERHQIINLNLSKLEPLSAFSNLKGRSAGKLIDIIPVTPLMSLDKKDSRFIETKEVLDNLDSQTNLACMDWQDFENLIAELFQKEFSEDGTEIKLTQSSRDKGVDAIVFNPDPIRGGKYVIQAKRYTNVVDVSAVRDLVAVVAHEGASRGILVTTSTFGADAYAFVQNKPITLLDGAKLLGLLEKHNYKFRVNIKEARELYPNNQKY